LRPVGLDLATGASFRVVHATLKEHTMIELNLPDMNCGHCASTVTQTCKLVDPAAKVQVDLQGKQVRIESSEERKDFEEALTEAGYPPAP
jgi:copper chaperone